MRKVEVFKKAENLEEVLIFESSEEREDFFRRNKKDLKKRQEEQVERLRRAYMDGVKKVDEAYLRELGLLRVAEDNSLLEKDLPLIPSSASPAA